MHSRHPLAYDTLTFGQTARLVERPPTGVKYSTVVEMMASDELVLVTGGSGFLAAHCIIALFTNGYRVRTTVRSMTRADDVRGMLKAGGASEDQVRSLEFAIADLTNDGGWMEASQGCAYVLHVASPFPSDAPKSVDELIVPAREGTLRALKAAKQAGTVKRVVVTSSVAAIGR